MCTLPHYPVGQVKDDAILQFQKSLSFESIQIDTWFAVEEITRAIPHFLVMHLQFWTGQK